jgi:vacuolar-type H+-ATPase subunit E/Vma4
VTAEAQTTALAPVRAYLLHEARAEADRIVAEAHREAAAMLAQARRGADQAVEQARTRGRRQTAPAAAAVRGRGREQARSIVLAARREAFEELRAQVLAAISGLRDEPGYQLLLARLTAMAADAAGSGAATAVPPTGGVVARSPRVIVDCTLPRLAGLAVDTLGSQVRELWTP